MGITDTVLLEVMRAHDADKLKHYVDVSRRKMAEEAVRTKGLGPQPKTAQYIRLARREFENYRTATKPPPRPSTPSTAPVTKPAASMWGSQNKRRVKLGAAAALLAAGAYGAYRHYKNKKAAQEKVNESTSEYFNRMLRESEIKADHVRLGLDVMKATGLDQAMAKQMSDGKQRRQAWKYGTRAAAAGLAAPTIGTAGYHAALLANEAWKARKGGARGIKNILRKAYEAHQSYAHHPAELVRQAGAFTFSKPWLGTVGTIGAAGGVYGLMKKAPAPPKLSMLKPKKQYKYIRKEGGRYVYPKSGGVR
jgi:hypothetical protein